MKKLALILLTVLALAGCGEHLGRNELAVPLWSCSQVPTGQSEMRDVSEYCGKGCRHDVPRKHYAIAVKCEYVEWRQE